MKKFYNDPSIYISLFEEENVVTTASGETPGGSLNSAEAGTNFIKGKLGDEATVLNFTF